MPYIPCAHDITITYFYYIYIARLQSYSSRSFILSMHACFKLTSLQSRLTLSGCISIVYLCSGRYTYIYLVLILVPTGFSIAEADFSCTRLSLNLLGTLRDHFPLVDIATRHLEERCEICDKVLKRAVWCLILGQSADQGSWWLKVCNGQCFNLNGDCENRRRRH